MFANKTNLNSNQCPSNCGACQPNMFGTIYILVCLRGVSGSMYKKIFSQGGQIDPGEDSLTAVIRETKEESGLDISTYIKNNDYHSHTCPSAQIFYILLSGPVEVAGPTRGHEWEVMPGGISGYKNMHGWSWVPLDKAIEISIEHHTKNHFFTRNLERGRNIF